MKTIISCLFVVIITLTLGENPVYSASNSDELKKGLQLMREEEKLAHDVYLALYEKWKIPVFSNIARSESRHFDAVGYLLDTFKIKDPAYEKIGKFRNKELAQMYDELIEQGTSSIPAALKVGAFIEELDIQDLQKQLGYNHNELVSTVFGNLLRASGNHLRAFTRQLESHGIEYEPVVLEEAAFINIVNSTSRPGRMHLLKEDGNSLPNCQQNIRMKGKGKNARANCIYN